MKEWTQITYHWNIELEVESRKGQEEEEEKGARS